MNSMLAVCHPWHCDVMGHMNTRHYAAIFDDATLHFLGVLAKAETSTDLGWADVRINTVFKNEARSGALLAVDTRLVKLGRSSITFEHVLIDRLSEEQLASAEITSVRFDLAARSSIEMSSSIREAASRLGSVDPVSEGNS